MKKLIKKTSLIIFGAVAFSMNASAQTVINSDEIISAQLNLTKNATRQIFSELQKNTNNSSVEHSDFNSKVKSFATLLDSELTQYENKMRSGVLGNLNIYINEYRNIESSANYSKEEKDALLAEVIKQITTESKQLKKNIRNLIDALITNIGFKTEYLNRKILEEQEESIIEPCGGGGQYYFNHWNGIIDEKYGTSPACKTAVLNVTVGPKITEGCYSQSCIILSKVMYTKFLTMIKLNLGKRIFIPINKNSEGLTIYPSTNAIDTFLEYIQLYNMNGDSLKLPFSMSQADLLSTIHNEEVKTEEALHKAQEIEISTQRATSLENVYGYISGVHSNKTCSRNMSQILIILDNTSKFSISTTLQKVTLLEVNQLVKKDMLNEKQQNCLQEAVKIHQGVN